MADKFTPSVDHADLYQQVVCLIQIHDLLCNIGWKHDPWQEVLSDVIQDMREGLTEDEISNAYDTAQLNHLKISQVQR